MVVHKVFFQFKKKDCKGKYDMTGKNAVLGKLSMKDILCHVHQFVKLDYKCV